MEREDTFAKYFVNYDKVMEKYAANLTDIPHHGGNVTIHGRLAKRTTVRARRVAAPKQPKQGIPALRHYLRVSGMTQQQFADFIGVRRETVWTWLRDDGPVRNIKPENIEKVRKKTGINIADRRRTRR